MAELEGNLQDQMKTIERLYKNAAAAVPELPLLINVPRKKLIRKLLFYWIGLFFSALFSINFFWMVTMIAFVSIFNKMYAFSKVWRAYGYSKLILWIPCLLIIYLGMSNTIRMFLLDGIKNLFRV
jgi:hypothetical protein